MTNLDRIVSNNKVIVARLISEHLSYIDGKLKYCNNDCDNCLFDNYPSCENDMFDFLLESEQEN